jgi:DNA-binding Lrp family transcriptional regulator
MQTGLEKLDAIDRKILAELDKNARISYSELGKRIRVAKETVKYRITQLEKRGIITEYYTVFNLSKLGFVMYRPYFRLHNTTPEIEKEIVDYLTSDKNVAILFTINGPYHIALAVWTHDLWDYEQVWLRFKKKFGQHISTHQLSQIAEYLEFTRPYLSPSRETEKDVFTTVSKTEQEKLDAIDYKLLRFISNNARASLVDIARKLGISIVTVRQHMKKLIDKEVILGFRATMDLNKLGREYYKVDMWLSKFDRYEELGAFIKSLPNVAYTERTVVTSDMEFDLEVTGFEEFVQIMDSIKERFPEDIRDYTYYSRIAAKKVSYAPNL